MFDQKVNIFYKWKYPLKRHGKMFKTAPNCKQLKYPLTTERLDKLQCIHAKEYYMAMKE